MSNQPAPITPGYRVGGLRKHYSIAFPQLPKAPIILHDYYQNKHREITLNEAGQFIIGAHLRDDVVVHDEDASGQLIEVISIVDKAEMMNSRERWVMENAHMPLAQAFPDVMDNLKKDEPENGQ